MIEPVANEIAAIAVLGILKAAFPNSFKMTKQDGHAVVSEWSIQLADVPNEVAVLAVRQLIATSVFPPVVAEVRERVFRIRGEAEEILRQRSSRIYMGRETGRETDEGYTALEEEALRMRELLKHFTVEIPFYRIAKMTSAMNPAGTPKLTAATP